jgi:hypothetical protein
MVKQSLEKQPTSERGATQNPDLIGEKLERETFPPYFISGKGKSQGNPMVEVATPKKNETIRPRERIKTHTRSWGRSNLK